MCRNTMRCVTELRWNTSARSTTTPTELCFRGRRTYRSSKFAASATVPNYNGTVIVISVLSGLRQRNNTYLGYRTGRWSNPGAEWCDTVTQVHTVDVGSLLFSLIFIHSFIHHANKLHHYEPRMIAFLRSSGARTSPVDSCQLIFGE